jgi:cobalt-zinc-cadmium efflux system membrane fusion protein
MSLRSTFKLCVLFVAGVWMTGCSPSAEKPAGGNAQVADEGHVHGEWWCAEHGVPEEVCALCDTSLVADFKSKGDWCEEHARPDSQCFICHPEKQAEFAAQYEAKYGKQPPKLELEGGEHKYDEHEKKV